MAIGIKVCKVCGKEYEACHTLRPNMNNEFRWQDVACSPEHGAEYLRRILESRGMQKAEPAEATKEEPAQKKRVRKKKNSEQDAAPGEEMA